MKKILMIREVSRVRKITTLCLQVLILLASASPSSRAATIDRFLYPGGMVVSHTGQLPIRKFAERLFQTLGYKEIQIEQVNCLNSPKVIQERDNGESYTEFLYDVKALVDGELINIKLWQQQTTSILQKDLAPHRIEFVIRSALEKRNWNGQWKDEATEIFERFNPLRLAEQNMHLARSILNDLVSFKKGIPNHFSDNEPPASANISGNFNIGVLYTRNNRPKETLELKFKTTPLGILPLQFAGSLGRLFTGEPLPELNYISSLNSISKLNEDLLYVESVQDWIRRIGADETFSYLSEAGELKYGQIIVDNENIKLRLDGSDYYLQVFSKGASTIWFEDLLAEGGSQYQLVVSLNSKVISIDWSPGNNRYESLDHFSGSAKLRAKKSSSKRTIINRNKNCSELLE